MKIFQNKSKKGVSPVIATVLLVALVIVLGLIVFLWMRGLAQETITKFGGENIEKVCDDVSFSASYSSGVLSISNIGNVPIFSAKVNIYKSDGYELESIKSITTTWPEAGLNQGQVFSGEIDADVSGAEKIVVIPILIGTSDEGKRSYTCDEDRYGYEIKL